MKKLLSLAMILATGTFIAQNVNNSTQNGYGNSVNVEQVGVDNNSLINQDGKNRGAANGGDDNRAIVKQNNGYNVSKISQLGDRNFGAVTQDGLYNRAIQSVGVGYAEDNVARSTQNGNSNYSSQTQGYDNNRATVNQNSLGAGGPVGNVNVAIQDQNSGKDGVAGSTATIDQIGVDNRATQTQKGSLNRANSNQLGFNNTSTETQTSKAGGTFTNMSWVNQTSFADGHSAVVKQDAVSNVANNVSRITQNDLLSVGGNKAFVTQKSGLIGGNVSNVTQTGTNTAVINQTGF